MVKRRTLLSLKTMTYKFVAYISCIRMPSSLVIDYCQNTYAQVHPLCSLSMLEKKTISFHHVQVLHCVIININTPDCWPASSFDLLVYFSSHLSFSHSLSISWLFSGQGLTLWEKHVLSSSLRLNREGISVVMTKYKVL